MKLKILNPVQRVTGSCYLLEYDHRGRHFSVLVDCGLVQGELQAERLNTQPFPFEPADIDVVVLTHAHLDHCGLIPRLYREGFSGRVLCTRETAELAQLVLEDAAKHSTTHDTEDLARVDWHEPTRALFGGYYPLAHDLFLRFFRTGHILGACAAQFVWGPPGQQKRITFSGDLGPCAEDEEHLPLLRHRMAVGGSDYSVVESTYGGTVRREADCRLDDRLERLEAEVRRAQAQRGVLVIPCFAIGRTQDVLLDLQILQAQGRLRGMPVFFDAVLAQKVNEVYAGSLGRLVDAGHALTSKVRPAWLGKGLYRRFGLEPHSPQDRAMLLDALRELFCHAHAPKVARRGALRRWSRVWAPISREAARSLVGPAVVVTGGGMCDGGRVQDYLRRLLTDSTCTVALTGYAAPSTIAGRLLELSASEELGRSLVEDRVGLKGSALELWQVEARIVQLSGYSAHADQTGLIQWLFPKNLDGRVSPTGSRRVFITHGEPRATRRLQKAVQLQASHEGLSTRVDLPPRRPRWFDLDNDCWMEEMPLNLSPRMAWDERPEVR